MICRAHDQFTVSIKLFCSRPVASIEYGLIGISWAAAVSKCQEKSPLTTKRHRIGEEKKQRGIHGRKSLRNVCGNTRLCPSYFLPIQAYGLWFCDRSIDCKVGEYNYQLLGGKMSGRVVQGMLWFSERGSTLHLLHASDLIFIQSRKIESVSSIIAHFLHVTVKYTMYEIN